IDRMQNVASATAHTIPGPVSATVVGIEREIMQQLLDAVSHAAALAAGRDTSHRWAQVVEAHAAALREGAPPPAPGMVVAPGTQAVADAGPQIPSDAPAPPPLPPADPESLR